MTTDNKRGNLLLLLQIVFPISSKGSLYRLFHRQDSTYRNLCYTNHKTAHTATFVTPITRQHIPQPLLHQSQDSTYRNLCYTNHKISHTATFVTPITRYHILQPLLHQSQDITYRNLCYTNHKISHTTTFVTPTGELC